MYVKIIRQLRQKHRYSPSIAITKQQAIRRIAVICICVTVTCLLTKHFHFRGQMSGVYCYRCQRKESFRRSNSCCYHQH